MPPSENQLRKGAAIRGVFIGLIVLVINVLSYYFITLSKAPFWLITVGLNMALFFIYIFTAAIFIENLRRSNGGYWLFKQAVSGIFILVTVAYAVNYLGRDVLFSRLIEPKVAAKTRDAIVKADISYLKEKNISQDSIQKNVAVLNTKINSVETVTVAQEIAAIPIILILLFVVSLVFAALFKKDPPVYRITEPDPTA